jgi:hypothetical protein
MAFFAKRKVKKEIRNNQAAINAAAERRGELYQRELDDLYHQSGGVEDDVFTAVATALLCGYVFLAYLPVVTFANVNLVEEDILNTVIDFSVADDLFLDALPMATTMFAAYFSGQRTTSPKEYNERIQRLANLFPYLLEEGKELTDFGSYNGRRGRGYGEGGSSQFDMRASRMIFEKINPDQGANGAMNILIFSPVYFECCGHGIAATRAK